MRSLPASTRRPATVALPALSGSLPEQHLEQRGLTGAVGSEHCDELAGAHGQVEMIPQHAVAECQAGAGQFGDDVSSHKQ